MSQVSRHYVEVRVIEEIDLTPGKARSYKAKRPLEARELIEVPTPEDGKGWVTAITTYVRSFQEEAI